MTIEKRTSTWMYSHELPRMADSVFYMVITRNILIFLSEQHYALEVKRIKAGIRAYNLFLDLPILDSIDDDRDQLAQWLT